MDRMLALSLLLSLFGFDLPVGTFAQGVDALGRELVQARAALELGAARAACAVGTGRRERCGGPLVVAGRPVRSCTGCCAAIAPDDAGAPKSATQPTG